MGKANGHGLEALAVRRAAMVDADKVRYRVYTTKDEFIAVIAESALMALRVSGVAEPHRIVRDLPTEGVTIAAERMEAGDTGQRVKLATEKVVRESVAVAPSVNPQAEASSAGFVPLQLGDLDQKRGNNLRILSAADLEALMGAAPRPAPVAPPEPVTEAEPVAEAAPEPVAEDPPADAGELSPEQVQALLNE